MIKSDVVADDILCLMHSDWLIQMFTMWNKNLMQNYSDDFKFGCLVRK